jgi:hypothetical protein
MDTLIKKAISGGCEGVLHVGSTRAMQQREVEIVNKLGLHARASAKLTQLAASSRAKCRSRATAARSTPRASWA